MRRKRSAQNLARARRQPKAAGSPSRRSATDSKDGAGSASRGPRKASAAIPESKAPETREARREPLWPDGTAGGRRQAPAAAPPGRPKQPPASSIEAYQELERTLCLVRDAVEAAETFDLLADELARRNIPEDRVRRVANLAIGGDLHLHSNASDGRFPPRKLPWLARVLGLTTIAVADHDSVDGCRDAFREGMLAGVDVLPAVELSTDTPGLEILAYFPDAGKFFSFLSSRKSDRFRETLARRQSAIHQKSLACLEHVNNWLRRQKVPADSFITLEEYDRWFGGQKPYYPGTLCVLGLTRLDPDQRDRLKIHDPRAFNTRVVTPFLRDYDLRQPVPRTKAGKPIDRLAEAFAIVATATRAGVPAATLVPHPKELVTKGKMSLGAVGKLLGRLAADYGLDGIEVACARDGEDDVRYWCEIVRQYNQSVQATAARRGPKLLLAASHGSDFHVLGPGLATGEITIGLGVLDSRPQYRRGNLRPQMPLDEFLEQLQQRACENIRR